MSALEVLRDHEIELVTFSPAPPSGGKPPSGWWVSIARCKCGYGSPPEHRADHLERELRKAGCA